MIYEYRCNSCQNVNEFQMKLSDPHPTTCPSCKSENSLERIISATSFALKGTGWYTSDYKRAASSAKTESKSSDSACGAPACGTGVCQGANAPKAEA